MKRQAVSIFLLAAPLAATACGEGSGAPASGDTTAADTATAPTETTAYLDTLPKTDMGGRSFVMLIEDRYSNGISNIHSGSETGDVVNDAIFRRDAAVAERYNIEFEYSVVDKREKVVSQMTNAIMAGDEAYHMAMSAVTWGAATLASSGLLYDLAELPHLSLDEAWWVSACNDRLRVGDALYFAASPIAPTIFATPFAITYNKRMANDYKLPDLYAEIKNGTWTIDRMQELAKGVSKDLDANGTMDEKDQYGIATHSSALWGYYASSGITPLVIHEDRSFDLTLGSAQSLDIIDRLAKVLSDRNEVYYYDGSNPSHADMFKNGQVLFADYSVTGFIITYRDMADDWGILPIPKLTEEQDGYHTTLQTILPCGICVPKNCEKPEETGLILETLAYYSNTGIRAAAYDTLLTGKVSRDEDSVAMLDIIYDDINVDLLYVYRFANAPDRVYASIMTDAPFASAYESIRVMMEEEIKTFIENVEGE
ncbi:MAG: hypothetical protein J6C52_08365 [Clostridia bacterium]|nr:hypothetical protein [Clostridia bacterium]